MIETVRDMVGSPGRYEGLGAFEVWLCERVNDCADETTGDDVEYGQWAARCGRFLVSTDAQGFWYVSKYATHDAVRTVFDALAADYAAWCGDGFEDDDDEPVTDGPLRGEVVTIHGRRGVAWYIDTDDGEQSITAHMVGDDRPEVFDRDDATVIAREDYCGECGQVGCEHDGLDHSGDDGDEDR